jgi:preprotein translocase subunit SecA
MTGTAAGHERELQDFYKLPVVLIPERIPNRRRILDARYFANQETKWIAIFQDICARFATGQPVLVGTRTIGESETLSQMLTAKSIPHNVLNGLQTEDEAELIASAGQAHAITIATNMAGRGTDIQLGRGVVELGGLHVIATQRQESLRVDRQLIGRSARQGEPGSCQFFVSAEDELIQQFLPEFGVRMSAIAAADGEVQRDLHVEMDRAQKRAERQRFQQRSDLYRQDQWMNEVLTAVAEKDVPAPELQAN